jgi:mRNA interferase YafQ
MASKKSGASKRTTPPRAAEFTKAFLKDWERLSRTGRFNMHKLKAAMILLIANDAPLGPEWLDHPLAGNWAGHRECHIGGDFLLTYRISEAGAAGMIVFVRAGTHAELFE